MSLNWMDIVSAGCHSVGFFPENAFVDVEREDSLDLGIAKHEFFAVVNFGVGVVGYFCGLLRER